MPSRPGRKSAAQTPAPKSERIYGSSKNKKGSAASKKTAKNITLSEKTIKSLENKLKEYNSKHDKKVSLNTVKAVYRRGAGAYSSSHRPTITGGVPNSRNAWAMARVNKFLKKASGQQVKAAYVQDDDLLEDGGKIDKISKEEKELFKNLIENWQEPYFRNQMDAKEITLYEKLVKKGLIVKGGYDNKIKQYYSDNAIENIELAYELVNELNLNETIGGGKIIRAYNYKKSKDSVPYEKPKPNDEEGQLLADGGMATNYNYRYNEFLRRNDMLFEDGGQLKPAKSLEEIAQIHGVEIEDLAEKLIQGIEVEKEHTDSNEMAETIALHHLEETPDYYEKLKMVESGQQEPQEIEYEDTKINNYFVWVNNPYNREGEAYDFADLESAMNHIKNSQSAENQYSIRNYCGSKLMGDSDIKMILGGTKDISEYKYGGELAPELEANEYLQEVKEEADAVLFSNRSKIGKFMICNANIETAEENAENAQSAFEVSMWEQVATIWEETKKEVSDLIFMYSDGGTAGHHCSCKKYSKGGLAYGNSHDKGGMPMKVESTGQNIEIEGGEGVVNKRSMQSDKQVEFEGKKMSPCEAVSRINQMGGGVKFKCPDVKEIIAEDGNF